MTKQQSGEISSLTIQNHKIRIITIQSQTGRTGPLQKREREREYFVFSILRHIDHIGRYLAQILIDHIFSIDYTSFVNRYIVCIFIQSCYYLT